MKFENNGIILWLGSDQSPAPMGEVLNSNTPIEILVQISPISASNRVSLAFSLNSGTNQTIDGRWIKNVKNENIQYFKFAFPIFQPGSKVEYQVVVRAGGKRLSSDPISFVVSSGKNEAKAEETEMGQSEPREEKESSSKTGYSVQGTIREANGQPAKATVVKAFDVGLRTEKLLGESTSNESGYYYIDYEKANLLKPGRGSADLRIKVYSDTAEVKAESEIYYFASSDQLVNLMIGGRKYKGDSEFDKITKEVNAILEVEDLTISDLEENLEVQDINLIEEQTNYERNEIIQLVLAHKLADKTDLPPAIFYGFFRLGEPPGIVSSLPKGPDEYSSLNFLANQIYKSLISLNKGLKQSTLKSAIRKNLIPLYFEEQLDETLAKLQDLQVEFILNQPYIRGKTPLKDLLAVVELDREKISVFLNYFVANQGNAEIVFPLLEGEEFSKNEIEELKTTLDLGDFTQNIIPMVLQIKEMQKKQEISSLRGLVGLSSEDWYNLIKKSSVNAEDLTFLATVKFDEKEDVVWNYAEILLERIQNRYPTNTFTLQLRKDISAPFEAGEDLISFFEKNQEIDLNTQNIELYLQANPKILEEAKEPQKLKKELKVVQRIFKLTPDYKVAKILVEDKIGDSNSVYFMGKDAFVSRYTGENKLSKEEAISIYQKAEQTYAATLSLAANYNISFHLANPKVVPNFSKVAQNEELLKQIPNLTTLFGSLDYCECEHCRSVYSPASYLVDTLRFLERRWTSGRNATQVLFKRRPDIGNIELSCENTNTTLPYIDLVCEVLEDAVGSNTAIPSKLRQTKASSEELKANPQYLNQFAYEKLKDAIFPFSLPFDLWNEQARIYFEHLGVPRYKLMKQFQFSRENGDNFPNETQINAEFLGLSVKEKEVILSQSQEQVWEYWGLKRANNELPDPKDISNKVKGDWIEVLSYIPVFQNRANLTFQELLQILEVDFIQGVTGQIFIDDQNKDLPSCDTGKMYLTGLNPQNLFRIQKFIRLWRKSRLQISELDLILKNSNLTANQINKELINVIAQLRQLEKNLGLNIQTLLSFWSDIHSEETPDHVNNKGKANESLYARLFRNKSVLKDEEYTFPKDPQNLTGYITDELTSIMGALNLSAAEVNLIRTHSNIQDQTNVEDGSISKVAINIENLSVLHRYGALSRSIKASVIELITAIKVSGTDPFFSPQKTLAFIEVFERIRKSKFSWEELGFLLLNDFKDNSGYILNNASIETYILELRIGLDKVEREYNNNILSGEVELFIQNALSKLPQLRKRENLEKILSVIKGGQWVGTQVDKREFIFSSLEQLNLTDPEIEHNFSEIEGSNENKESIIFERFEFIFYKLKSFSKESFIVKSVSEAFETSDIISNILLNKLYISKNNITISLLDILNNTRLTQKENSIDGKEEFVFRFTIDANNFPLIYKSYKLLHKVSSIIDKLNIKTEFLKWYFEYGFELGLLNLNSLLIDNQQGTEELFSTWENLDSSIKIIKTFPNTAAIWYKLWSLATKESYKQRSILDQLSKAIGWDFDSILLLTDQFGYHKDDYKKIMSYNRIIDCYDIIRKLGLNTVQCFKYINPELNQEDSRAIRQIVKSKYENENWLKISPPLQDLIREKKRKALVDFLLANPNLSDNQYWIDENDLYSYFLIDVEMSSCQYTSRIKQATLSIQLFVQRCLLNLEPEVVADSSRDEDWLEWKWMKNYRVWEANRKVFLYPENWIEPELMDRKTPFFKDLEDELLQNDISHDNAELAFLHYLEKLDDVANLEICGMYLERGENIIHVIGRTQSDPHIYYYRQRVKGNYWTAWEKIDLDIKSEHILPVIWNRRLYLFWSNFIEKSEEISEMPIPSGDGNSPPAKPPKKYWEIKLAWSEYKNGKWSPKKLAKNKLLSPIFGSKSIAQKYFHFQAQLIGKNLRINVFLNVQNISAEGIRYKRGSLLGFPIPVPGDSIFSFGQRNIHWAYFNYYANGTEPEVFSNLTIFEIQEEINLLSVSEGETFYSSFKINRSSYAQELNNVISITLNDIISPSSLLSLSNNGFGFNTSFYHFGPLNILEEQQKRLVGVTLLGIVPSNSSITFPHQNLQFDDDDPFFYQDRERRYLVLPLGWQKSQYRQPRKVNSSYNYDSVARKRYLFNIHYHPYSSLFIQELNYKGIEGLLNRKIQLDPSSIWGAEPVYNFNNYNPTTAVDRRYPHEEVDFEYDGSYAQYNWELFFHAPFLIATRLSQNQRFEEAMRWFHYIFDPTNTSTSDPIPNRYWITNPFYKTTKSEYNLQDIKKIMESIARKNPKWEYAIKDWRQNPFQPHAIARLRTVAYQKAVVMKYIDNLIAWADQLFRRDTFESINEATQLYILAAEILGPRPQLIPSKKEISPKTYNEIRRELDEFGNAIVEIENLIPPARVYRDESSSYYNYQGARGRKRNLPASRFSNGKLPPIETLYFCIPPNEELEKYWDLVADRLFKVRNCLNIEGIFRQLPLFEPPIDPALLVRATAAGLDLSSVLNDLNAPNPIYRFNTLIQKATELCNDLKALGASLLGVLEKKDAEELSLLRSSHEIQLLKKVKEIREKQKEEAEFNLESLKETKELAKIRKDYYGSRDFMNTWETVSMSLSGVSMVIETSVAVGYILSGGLKLIPNFLLGASGFGGSPHATAETGGKSFGDSAEDLVQTLSAISRSLDKMASMASTMGGYQRRSEDWDLQRRLAEKEMDQIDQQIEAAAIRKEIADMEARNQELQIENAESEYDFLKNKFTNKELYSWMVSQVSTIYFQSYQLAYDMAKKAEKAYGYELGIELPNFIQFGYWDSLKKGLLSGDKLLFDLKRLEASYFEQNKREFELTKSISLLFTDSISLLKLRETGECFLNFPESLFDHDYPGHFMRRIKSVSISIPCILGPFNNINCTLTLINHSTRISNVSGSSYERNRDDEGSFIEDTRFRDGVGSVQSIATSNAQNDSGLFDLNFRDERFLPFEGVGAISTWHLKMPVETNYFDFNTISDVILTIRYTARDGGENLKIKALEEVVNVYPKEGYKLISAKQQFPNEWHKFLTSYDEGQKLKLPLDSSLFPYRYKSKEIKIHSFGIFLKLSTENLYEDYIEGNHLEVLISSPNGLVKETPSSLQSTNEYKQVPFNIAVLDAKEPLGNWEISISQENLTGLDALVKEVELGEETIFMLNDEKIGDLILLLNYEITE